MSYGDHITRNRGAIRFLLFALGVPQALIGLWALLAPGSFHDDFPVGTAGWVDVLGPFDEHLVTDVGALFVGLGFLLCFAAVSLRRGTVIAAAISWLIFAIPHLVWHVFNLEPYSTGDAIGNVVTLVWTVVGGLLVLVLLRTRPAQSTATAGVDGARVAGVPDSRAGLMARSAYSYSRRAVGQVMEPTRVYAHHPTLLAGYGALEYATEKADRVPRDLKALASTKAAALAGCEFCIDIASSLATKEGVAEAKLRALPDHRTSPAFSEVERLVLDLAVGMTRTPVDVSDELFARLREHFDEAQLVELANEIAIENYRARFNWAFGIGSQGFAEGAVCARAEAVPA
ncbi:MAG TPA: carboxymuconolactone decarboxylase family protein [Thermoleophilaceae bacterium]|nr:carboxymuconolactone decarboxylase family protein [Thermoleophilaceae bacterium]